MKYQRNNRLLFTALLATTGATINTLHAANIFVTGYNFDVVYEIGGTPNAAGKVPNEDEALFERGLPGSSATAGLPTTAGGRILTSALDG